VSDGSTAAREALEHRLLPPRATATDWYDQTRLNHEIGHIPSAGHDAANHRPNTTKAQVTGKFESSADPERLTKITSLGVLT
jgi:hypothetical protein